MFIYLVEIHRDYEAGSIEAVCKNLDVAHQAVERLLDLNNVDNLEPTTVSPQYLGLGHTCVGEATMWDVSPYRGPGDQITITKHAVSEK